MANTTKRPRSLNRKLVDFVYDEYMEIDPITIDQLMRNLSKQALLNFSYGANISSETSIGEWEKFFVQSETSPKAPAMLAHHFDELWSWADHLAARGQGWFIDRKAGVVDIYKSIHTTTFDSDAQARAFFEMLVDNGDPLAVKANAALMARRLTA